MTGPGPHSLSTGSGMPMQVLDSRCLCQGLAGTTPANLCSLWPGPASGVSSQRGLFLRSSNPFGEGEDSGSPLPGCPGASVRSPYTVLPLQTLSFQRGFSSHETPGPLVWPCPVERRLESRLSCVPNSSTARKPSRGKCNVCRPGQAHGHFIKTDSWENINQQFTL